jgi:hypothetical protein
MAFSDLKEQPCLCSFIQNLGPMKATFESLIDSAITLLTAIKATMALWPVDLGDQLLKLGYDTEIACLEALFAPLEVPFVLIIAKMQPYADCPPVATMAKTVKDVRDAVMKPLDDEKTKVNQLIYALNLENTKSERLDMLIQQLKDVKSALELCNVE